MNTGIDRILHAIEEYGDQYCQAVETEAKAEGEAYYELQLEEAKQELAERRIRYQEEAALVKRREIAKYEAKAKQTIGEFQLMHIDTVLEETLDYFINLSEISLLELINRALERHNGGMKPRIHVAEKNYQIVFDAIGNQYQVINDPNIRYGFILDFKDYDVNYEFEKVFVYNRNEYVQKAMKLFFEE